MAAWNRMGPSSLLVLRSGHADATALTLRLHTAGGHLVLSVADDGTHRASTGGDGLTGFGMRSMRARTARLGGTFSLDTESGTTVRVAVPLGAAEPV